MLRDILFSRAILVGIVCFVLIVGGTQFYRWQVLRGGAVSVLPTDGSPQHSETKKERDLQQARGVLTETLPLSQKPETPDTEPRQISDATAGIPKETEVPDLTDVFFPGEATEAEAPPEAFPVSPFGFGPYPKVPVGYPSPESVPWNWTEETRHRFREHLRDFELMARVMIKL